jgi:hypothetical protein
MHSPTSAPASAEPLAAALAETPATPWAALCGVVAGLALVAWAGAGPGLATGDAPGLECRIKHPAGSATVTTVMLVNTSGHTLPAGTEWAWAAAGGDPQRGERHWLSQPLPPGGAVRVPSTMPAVALRCRAALRAAGTPVAAAPRAHAPEGVGPTSPADALLSPR